MKTPLRSARLIRGLTIMQVAVGVNCDVGNLSRMERGLQKPSLDLAARLSEFFGSDLTELQILYPERFVNSDIENHA